MQKLSLKQSLSQKLSPQQIQFIKLLQVPTVELEARIKEELEVNPALEEGSEQADAQNDADYGEDEEYSSSEEESYDEDISLDEYMADDSAGYKMYGDGNYNDEDKEVPVVAGTSVHEGLKVQLGFLRLDERQYKIGLQLIGSIEHDGYIRRDLEAISNDLIFSQNIDADADEIESILFKIQQFDPPGIGARDLRECLLLQLYRKQENDIDVENSIKIIDDFYESFVKKHYEKIKSKLGIDDDTLRDAINNITKLNPKPGGSDSGFVKNQVIIPDFILRNENNVLDVQLNSRNAPELRVSRSYNDLFDSYEKSNKKDKELKQTVSFVKQKLDAAKWFIDAIKQRQNTLLRTMKAIIEYQYDFFMEGDEQLLKPMILKDIADRIEMDISTVSRIANSKYIQTEFGIYPLKYFFSEALTTSSGEDVSSREVKSLLKSVIDEEDKKKPLSDEKLEKIMKEKGYNIARRTVAKYREQLNIPVARLRKEI